ncbi:MAG: SEL1-like repeat protein [Prevotella sp.]|nr:SEL1-like repeat protein [Prevotella sp.]
MRQRLTVLLAFLVMAVAGTSAQGVLLGAMTKQEKKAQKTAQKAAQKQQKKDAKLSKKAEKAQQKAAKKARKTQLAGMSKAEKKQLKADEKQQRQEEKHGKPKPEDLYSKHLKALRANAARLVAAPKAKQKDLDKLVEQAIEAKGKHPEEAGIIDVTMGEVFRSTKVKSLRNYQMSLGLYRQAVGELAGNDEQRALALYSIGLHYYCGYGEKQDFDSAFVYFEQAQQLDRRRSSGYAEMIEMGLGVPQDLPYALACYEEAIQAGSQDYAKVYALRYALQQQAEGTLDSLAFDNYQMAILTIAANRDAPTAMRYLREAVNAGYIPAIFELGTGFFQGTYGEQDPLMGMKLLKQAADAGYLPAMHNYAAYAEQAKLFSLKNVFNRGSATANVYPYYRSAADAGYAPSQFAIARCYQYGLAVRKDYNEAYKWYAAAESQGYPGVEEGIRQMEREIHDEQVAELVASLENIACGIQQSAQLFKRLTSSPKPQQQGRRARNSDEKAGQVGKNAGGNRMTAADYQREYDRYVAKVKHQIEHLASRTESDNRNGVRGGIIRNQAYRASENLTREYQRTMQRWADRAAQSGYSIKRSAWETTSAAQDLRRTRR